MDKDNLLLAIVKANSYVSNIENTDGGTQVTIDDLKQIVNIFAELIDKNELIKHNEEDSYCYDSFLGTVRPLE